MEDISFTIDAGLINRLGKELVGRSETAVSELIKNAYDADARKVEVNFINSDNIGGRLIIKDDGNGMNKAELINGFMRLSSTDKIHNPVSPIFKRIRAGRKGIGRFATQLLGKKLTIITKKAEAKNAIKLVIDWNKYLIDSDLTSIKNTYEEISPIFYKGTKLIIHDLNEIWTESQIKRVFRYISELLQPDFLSDRSKLIELSDEQQKYKIATQLEPTFSVTCFKTVNDEKVRIADEDKMIFSKSVAIFEGVINENNEGYCSVRSEKFQIKDSNIPIHYSKKEDGKFPLLKDIHFKVYYYIFNRPEYYVTITRSELKRINELLEINGGIKLYRNGFRVLPYGESSDDWLRIDADRESARGEINVPFNNKNFYGFVEVIDLNGETFEETASREGLIENEALKQLKEFVYKSLVACTRRTAEGVSVEKSKKRKSTNVPKSINETLDDIKNVVSAFVDNQSSTSITQETSQDVSELKAEIDKKIEHVKAEFEEKIEKIGMYRVLASLGLTIEMFSHEVQTFNTVFNGLLTALHRQDLDKKGKEIANELKIRFDVFKSYTSYFNAAASKNESRKIEPINLRKQVNIFIPMLEYDSRRSGIEILPPDFYDSISFYTKPMHPAEWQSILLNLYSNSKKAIIRQRKGIQSDSYSGKIKIIVGIEKNNIYLEFLDNGDGIPEANKDRIFNAFFTTSSPASFDDDENDAMTGTGLGLRIVADILESYDGNIFVTDPISEFNTSIRIEIPKATDNILAEYGEED